MKLRSLLAGLAMSLSALAPAAFAADAPYDDGMSASYAKALAGKKVAFVPLAMSFDIAEGWVAGMQKQADDHGYQLIIRDPNWNTSGGAQAITQLIAEKPDIIIVHNPDLQSYARLIKKAMDAGINVIQTNLKSTMNSDVYIGADWYKIAERQAQILSKTCGEGSGKSGKVAIIQGIPTNATSAIGVQAMQAVFSQHKEIQVVANQAADFDPTKAHTIALTILKQNPDLCGMIGIWDAEDVGVAAAIRDVGKTGQVALISQGAGAQSACDKVSSGDFTSYIAYDVAAQSRDITNAIAMLLQTKPKPGSAEFALYSPLKVIDKDTLHPDTCWTTDRIKRDN